ncbi:MAG: hypothetical protein WAW06_06160 [bacterium]
MMPRRSLAGNPPGPLRLAGSALVAVAVIWGWVAPAACGEPLRIVDFPTAGLYARGEYGFDMDLYSDGGLLFGVGVGIARFVSFGASYGGLKFIGSGDPDMNPRPEVNVRVRLLEEDVAVPAVAVGFDSQGYGKFFDTEGMEERYLVKSRGIYAVASKNWDLLGAFSLHGGVSYSLENDVDNDPTVFVGAIKALGQAAEFAAEFDLGANDDKGPAALVQRWGYLNASVSWYVNENFLLAFKVRDIAAEDRRGVEEERKWNRGFSLSYRAEL